MYVYGIYFLVLFTQRALGHPSNYEHPDLGSKCYFTRAPEKKGLF